LAALRPAEAFRPYNPVLAALTRTCYWWGWVPTCGLTALLSASAIQQWYVPGLPVEAVAITIVLLFSFVNLCGIKWVARLAMPVAMASASLAFISSLAPISPGDVDWHQAFDYHLTTPFEGWFGDLTAVLAGLYLIGFAAPAFEAAAIWFVMLNMFHGTLQPLAGAARTMSQLADDGLLPRFLSLLLKATDCPWAATTLTATAAIIFLIAGDPVWMIAAANFTYLIGICMPNIAAYLLRRDQTDAERPYRAPRGTIMLGIIAAVIWLFAAILGFQQFGLPTVVFGLALAYSGAALYAWRVVEDRLRAGLPALAQTLHVKLTGAMVAVLALDGIAYLLAVNTVAEGHHELVSVLADIFVVVALLTVSVGLVLPGMITYSALEVSSAAKRLTRDTLRDSSNAMGALGPGNLEEAHASVNIVPVR
jgi:amino acid transporter